jgi:putative nucleotidyltransferase with HDIG domain
MTQGSSKGSRIRTINQRLLQAGILVFTAGLSLAALVLPIATRPSFYPMQIGDVAPQDIQAPAAISYVSEVQTEQLRSDAEQRVSPVYLPAEPAITRQQIELLRASLNFISSVRADAYASLDEKLSDLSAMENLQLNREDTERILAMTDTRWQTVQQEALAVLEQVMRNTIREGQVKEAQRSIPTMISFTLPQEQALTVDSLVTPFVIPNSLYSDEQTAAARFDAREKIEPFTRTFVAGEIIVRRGQIINASTYEALQQFNLIETPDNIRDVLGAITLVVAMFGFSSLYFIRGKTNILDGVRSLGLLALVFILFLYFARLIIPNRTVIPYIYPIPAFGLAVACLFNYQLAMVLSLVLSILAAYGLPNSLDLTLFYAISSLVGVLILGKGLRIGSFFTAGLGVGAAGSAIILAYRLPDTLTDLVGITTLVAGAFFNGLASASIALIIQFLFAQILGMATALQLLEISRPDHPLQQFILQNAPGSYQHSLQVAVLAEQAAEKVGADTLLVRVGAIYHDAGKAVNPQFYIENQVPGKLNSHDDLDPVIGAQTIIRHVLDSVKLAKKYRLPSRLMDFMLEHHGTLITRYQYAKALEAVGNDPSKVNIEMFRYPGPRPQSRETALLMLADGCQARARAELPQDEEELTNLVRKVISFCQQEGQLDDTRLTLRDLNLITDSFVKTLQNSYHPRIRYPEIRTTPDPKEPETVSEEPQVANTPS